MESGLLSDTLCKCLCSRDVVDGLDRMEGAGFIPNESELQQTYPAPAHPLLAYSTEHNQPLRGVPIREGDLWFLCDDFECAKVPFSLYINGFKFTWREVTYTYTLSPFTVVRFCRLDESAMDNMPPMKIFKVSLFVRRICYYFGVEGSDCGTNEERAKWVLDISHVVQLVTQSVFPVFTLSCDALVAKQAETSKRLLAGYLLHCRDEHSCTVLYCELSAPQGYFAKLVAYENAACEKAAFELFIVETTFVSEKVGINCSCFCLDHHTFATRTSSERKLWLRALSNMKVKLHNRAPIPSDEDIEHYRHAVRDQIATMQGTMSRNMRCDPLLQPTDPNLTTPRLREPEVLTMASVQVELKSPETKKGEVDNGSNGANGHGPSAQSPERRALNFADVEKAADRAFA